MHTDHWHNDFFYSIKKRVYPKKQTSPYAVLIRFLILIIALFLVFSITADDQSQISYASENLTCPESFNSSSELIDPSGTVTSWAGYPVSGLTVSAWQGTELISQTITDGNGAYNLDLAPGTYDLTAGGIATGEGEHEYFPQTQQVEVQDPVTVNFQDMLLKNSVYGVITDANGNPLQYTMAEVYDDEGNCIDDNDAGADGHYKLDLSYYFNQQDPSVPSGNFWVVFYGDQLLEQEFNVQVNRDEAYRLDAIMQPATVLQGTVTGQSTAIDDGTDETSEVILYFTDPNGNEGTDYCTLDHTKNYYFEVDPSLVTVHHVGMTVYGYHEYYQPISLTPEEVNIHNITLVEKGIITVNVTNSTNQPLNEASVSVQSESFDYLLYTDTDGMLSFAVEDDDWTVSASHNDYNKVVEYLTVSGGGAYQINLTLVKEGLPAILEGFITDVTNNNPLANVPISFEADDDEYGIGTFSDENGHYLISTNTSPYFVSGSSGYLRVYPNGYHESGQQITVVEGQNPNLNFSLNPYTGIINVYVCDVNDQPVSNAHVLLSSGGYTYSTLSTDSTGKVVFENCEPNTQWEIQIYDGNEYYRGWTGYYGLEDGETKNITGILFPYTLQSQIRGYVVDDYGDPVNGASVQTIQINGDWNWSYVPTSSDINGYFYTYLYSSANLMRVTISKTGYQTISYDFVPADLPVNQNFLLNLLNQTVSGKVKNYMEENLQGVSVQLWRGTSLLDSALTDANGNYDFLTIPGNYELRVALAGYIPQTANFYFTPEMDGYTGNFILTKNNSLYGIVVGDTIAIYDYNIPISGALIKLYQNGNPIESATSNINGYFQTNTVPAGDYTLQIQALNYETLIQSINIMDGIAIYQYFILQPSTSCGIHGYVTDENTGLPISNVNIGLFNVGEEEHVSDTTTDQNGFYSFSNLAPGFYNLQYIATNYVTSLGIENGSLQLDIGQDAELNKALEPIVPSTIEGTVTSWSGPVAGATVTLDNTSTTLTGSDGKFIFTPVVTDWHEISVNKSGITNSWSGWIENNEYKTISLYLNAKVLETDPVKDSTVQNLDQIKVRVFETRPDLNTASLSVSSSNGAVSGSITRENDWIIFTPSGGSFTTQGKYTVTTTIPSELSNTFEFYYYPITDTPPVVQIVSPSSGSFFRDPTSISMTANIQNDVGNGISTDSKIYLDGVALPTTLSGRQMTATATNFAHGWHTIRAVAVDNQGLTSETRCTIFISLQTPSFSNLDATKLFSAHYDNMHIVADVNEPIKSAYVTFDGYPNYQLSLGNFNDKIDAYWNGMVKLNSWSTIIHPDGPVIFTLHGQGLDGVWFTTATGSSEIDSTPPVITFDNNYFNSHDLDVTGYISDYCGVSTFDASSSGGSLQKSFSSGNFDLNIIVDADGKYTVAVNATDLAGNMGSASQVIWVDTVNPTIQFITPSSDSEVTPGQVISFRLLDNYSGLNRDYLPSNWKIYPQNYDIFLDGVSIKDQINWSNFSYDYYEYNPSYGNCASLLGITGTYQPSQHGYLNDGLHELKITLSDLAGNEIERILTFSSITKNPEASEKDMDMKSNSADQTLWTSFNVKENNDAGFADFKLYLDGSNVPELASFISTGSNQGTVTYTLTRNFTPGPHTLTMIMTDGLGLTASVDTGFYFDLRVGVPTSGYTTSSDYLPDVAAYTGVYVNSTSLLSNVYFKPGNQAIYGLSQIFAPATVMCDPKIPMGFQSAITTVQLASVDAGQNTHLSLWMTDISDSHNSYWGWGEAISVYFYDGSQTSPTLETRLYNFDDSIIYAHHQPPWGNVAGLVDEYVATAIGADGKKWKQYIIPIPEGLDKSHLSVIIAWRTVNWNSWGSTITTKISSKVDGLEFFTPLVDQVYPVNEATNIPLSPTVSAHFRIPMDPEMFTSDYFYLKDSKGNTAFTTNSFNSATGWGNMVPNVQLDGKTTYTAYISSEIRTIYGRILPEPSPYSWTFTTREGESARWQTIWYNGEQYDIYLTFGPGYNGYKPGYISPSTIASQAGAPLLGIYITKEGYEIADMDLKKTIFLAAERKAFYESLGTMDSLIDQAQIDYADDAANSILADIAYYTYLTLFYGEIPVPPDSEDTIRSSIARALADGFDQTHVPGYINEMLSWFKTGLTGADKINTAIGKLQKLKGETSYVPTQKAIGKTISIYQLVDGEISFSMELAEYTFELLWELEVADYYRPQLEYIRDHSTSDTRTAINQLLNWDKENVELRISEKIVDHIRDQTIAFTREAIEDELMATPAAPAIIIKKVLIAIVNYLGVFDAHSQAHTAVDLAGADANFYHSRNMAVYSLPTSYITPDDLSLVSTASRMWYSTAGDFYDTMSAMVNIVKNWPSLLSGADETSLNQAIASYNTAASNYHSHASNMIPELSGSTNDINSLFSLIKSGTTGKPAYIQIGAYSPIALLVTDELGRRIGYDPVTGQNVNDFAPDGGYTGPYTEPQLISIPAMAGQLTIQAFGTGTGTYTIDLETYDENCLLISGSTWTGTAVPGVTQIFTLAVDGLGDVFPVDAHPPEITVNGITEGTSYTSPVTPEIIITDDNLESWYATLNGVNYTGGSVSAEGVYSLFIRATDGINVVYKTIQFSIDLTPPQINILGFNDGDYSQMVLPYVKVIDDNLASINLKLDGIDYIEDPVRTEGQHTFTAVATDDAGHQSSASGSFIIDHTNPTIDIFGLVNGTVYQGGVSPTISINDLNLLLSNLTLDGNIYNKDSVILNTLRHHLIVDAVDKAGNHATREIWFIVIPDGGVIITDAGGTVTSGSSNLNFPNGAVNNDTAVTITQLSGISNIPSNFIFTGQAFDVLAENLENGIKTSQMNQAVTISINYMDSDVIGVDENSLVIFYWDNVTSSWKALPSTVDTANNMVTGTTDHFSTFALMGTIKEEPSPAPESQLSPMNIVITPKSIFNTYQSLKPVFGYLTSGLLNSASSTSPVSSNAASALEQQSTSAEETNSSNIGNWALYLLIFIVVVLIIIFLSRRIIRS